MRWTKISKNRLEEDFLVFLTLYNFDVRQGDVCPSWDVFIDMGVTLEPISFTERINHESYVSLDNTILFYVGRSKPKERELMRHLKNIVSHSHNIRRGVIDGVEYYTFNDRIPPRTYTMKGRVCVDRWRNFKNGIIESFESIRNRNIELQ